MPTPTITPTPSPTPAPVSAARIDNENTWQELFNNFSPAEQACIRTEVGGELDSVLGDHVMMDDDLTDWQVSLFECLTPETARSVYTSLLVAGIQSDESYEVTEGEIECVSTWVAGADVHRVIRGMADDDLTVLGELMSGVLPCLAGAFLPDFLTEMGIDPDSLTEDELACLKQWMVGFDLFNIRMEEGLGIIGEFFPGFMSCVPEPFLAFMFEDVGIDVDALSSEEKECLAAWVADLGWDGIITATVSVALLEEDEAYSVLAEVFGLLACIPDLDLEDLAGSGGADYQVVDFTDATRIGIGESVEGLIDYAAKWTFSS